MNEIKTCATCKYSCEIFILYFCEIKNDSFPASHICQNWLPKDHEEEERSYYNHVGD